MNCFRGLIFVVFSVLAVFSSQLLAVEVLIVDQDGKPVKDAFVAIPSGSIEQAADKPAVMDQVDVAFVPHVLAVDQGQAVVFPNSDNIRHHVYSFSDPKKFEIKLYQGVPEQPIIFDKPGLVALGCNIHDSMLGYIYVSPWPVYAVTSKSGKLTFDQVPEELAIWHPRMKGKSGVMRKQIQADEVGDLVKVALSLKKPKSIPKFKRDRRRYYD